MTASVQPAFSFRSAEASGELHRRNQPAFKPYASDRPVLKKIAGPTCHICVLCGPRFLLPLYFHPTSAAAACPRSLHAAAFTSSRPRAATTRRRSPASRAAAAARLQAEPPPPLLARCHAPPFHAAAVRPRAHPAPLLTRSRAAITPAARAAVLHAFHTAAAAPRRSSSSTPQPHP